ncbi:tetrahydrofolate synthase [Segatella salivae]|uniref:tetrahydrofolate synthase n=1 Tax=Segatella salivae TaxID=228604 RepID=UPI0028E7EADF|nr:tetrahydrofolate synthase [Segatella salivae]
MDISAMMNVVTTQRRWYCAIIPMNEFRNINVLTMQLGTSCSFDSPGLARNEPTPGEHPQGDSTPSVLSFFYEGMLTIKPFMAD